jgi:hypothetical protein
MKKRKLILLAIFLTALKTFGQTTTEIAKTGIKSTVSIVALDKISQPLGYGSGFIIDDELIVTNVHVIEGSSSAYVLLNGEEKKYTVSGYVSIDKANDLVILKISGLYGTKLSLGSETPPEIGEKIFAVGNPKGFNGTFSEGIVSGIRNLQSNQVLQITAPISPGSSGGPVLNSSGQVVGIAFASFTGGQNLNFAIPVKELLNLKSKIGNIISISLIKPQAKTNNKSEIIPNIKEGVTLRNIDPCFKWTKGNSKRCLPAKVFFSLKNNLPQSVKSIKVLLLIYDKTGTVVSYTNKTLVESNSDAIAPFMARSFEMDMEREGDDLGFLYAGEAYVKMRILDFQIIEE